ncbi:ArsC family protein [Planctomycetes bacterium Poly30]|uniref:ArsC family protein n=1 Tax=Saltatorellus ferox TaxID=2528018 RepID=A0A518F147_9BACT|nr:ArsC family protein [Planctomycetes bacterium Poly30]
MLDEHGVDYRYREYREEPFDEDELRSILDLLGLEPHELLRPKESAAAGLDASTPPTRILSAMADDPTLVQRPILTNGQRAILARPADLLIPFLAADGPANRAARRPST